MSNLTEAILLTDYIANSRKPEDNQDSYPGYYSNL
jgi:hypothetical protein